AAASTTWAAVAVAATAETLPPMASPPASMTLSATRRLEWPGVSGPEPLMPDAGLRRELVRLSSTKPVRSPPATHLPAGFHLGLPPALLAAALPPPRKPWPAGTHPMAAVCCSSTTPLADCTRTRDGVTVRGTSTAPFPSPSTSLPLPPARCCLASGSTCPPFCSTSGGTGCGLNPGPPPAPSDTWRLRGWPRRLASLGGHLPGSSSTRSGI
ncbi:hypothetical protein V8C86DRAFT_2518621, partial [Haematococcus lacustris]